MSEVNKTQSSARGKATGENLVGLLPCKKCGGEMKLGKALENTERAGIPDFPSQERGKLHRGQSYTLNGPAVWRDVLKCVDCGYSHTAAR